MTADPALDGMQRITTTITTTFEDDSWEEESGINIAIPGRNSTSKLLQLPAFLCSLQFHAGNGTAY